MKQPADDDQAGHSRPSDPSEHGPRRKLAEWVSLGISLLIILSLAGFLVHEALQPSTPFVQVEVNAQLAQAAEAGGRFIVPVQVINRGRQSIQDLKVELRYHPAGGSPETADLLIDYLGQRAEQTVYFYFDEHPRLLNVEARAASYRVQ